MRLSSLYKIYEGNSWDSIEHVAPEAMVDWDSTGRQVDDIGVIAGKIPYVHSPEENRRYKEQGYWVWIDGRWDQWTVHSAREVIDLLTNGWAKTGRAVGSTAFRVTSPGFENGYDGDWAMWVEADERGPQYSMFPVDNGRWSNSKTLTPKNVEAVLQELKTIGGRNV